MGRRNKDIMPSTHLSLHYHFVFSTKDRRPIIATDWRQRLHAYLGGAVKAINGIPEIIGGTNDHVHALVGLRATHRLADVLREIKDTSSQWVHETLGVRDFAWQEGYGAFTVSVSQLATVKEYIANQEAHHRTKSFQEEYIEFLKKHCVD
jgi:putative transposase